MNIAKWIFILFTCLDISGIFCRKLKEKLTAAAKFYGADFRYFPIKGSTVGILVIV